MLCFSLNLTRCDTGKSLLYREGKGLRRTQVQAAKVKYIHPITSDEKKTMQITKYCHQIKPYYCARGVNEKHTPNKKYNIILLF